MIAHSSDLAAFETQAGGEHGPFGDHLRRILLPIQHDAGLAEAVRAILAGAPCPAGDRFYIESFGQLLDEITRRSAIALRPDESGGLRAVSESVKGCVNISTLVSSFSVPQNLPAGEPCPIGELYAARPTSAPGP
jgi:hypothetical protein